MKKALCIVILLLVTASLFSQSAMDYYNMAQEARANHEYQKAIENYSKAGELWLEEGRKDYYAIMQNNVGYLYFGLGKYDLALEYYERALAIDEELGKKAGVAIDLNNIGGVYKSWGKYDLALEYFERALAIGEELGNKAEIAIPLNNIGGVYDSWGKYDLALEYYERALAIDEELGNKAGVARDLNNIGMVYYQINDYKEAIDYFSRSIERIEQLRRTARGEIRRDYLSSQIGTYQYLVSSTIRSGNDTEAFSAAEQTKARYLLEKMGERLEIEEIEFPPAEEIQGGLDQDEAILLYANIGWDQPALVLMTGKTVRSLEFDLTPFVETVESKYKQEIDFTLELTRGMQIQRGEDDEEETRFEKIISFYRYLLTRNYLGAGDKKKLDDIGRELYHLLIGPVAGELAGKTKLLIVPDGPLGFLPFETFITDSGKYLIEDYHILYSQSLAVSRLAARRHGGKYGRETKQSLAAFGGAVYEGAGGPDDGRGRNGTDAGQTEAAGEAVSEKEIVYAITRGAEHYGDVYDRLGLRWSDLPGTLEEVREIGKLFPESMVYTGADVNEALMKRLSASGELRRYGVLHFSTHGMVVPEYPELSALVLSQVGEKESGAASGEDGYLCMTEIADLDIAAEFVNLSACETGLGKLYAGEGVVGLTQSFLLAGAKGLSVSLWQVADESTKEFMVGMYRLVKDEGLSYDEAIREMKLEFLGGAAYGGKYKNPFYWAPFVYYGE